jgi:hypothetical protein
MSTSATISFNTDGQYLGRVELVMFNCLQWEIILQNIRVLTASSSSATPSEMKISVVPTMIASCDSLVRVCISLNTGQAVHLQFFPFPAYNWVHLAEVMFNSRSSMCPPDTIIPPPHTTAPPPDTTTDTNTPPPQDITIPTPSATTTPPDITATKSNGTYLTDCSWVCMVYE